MPESIFTGNLVQHLEKSAKKFPELNAVISATNDFRNKNFKTLYSDVKIVSSFFKQKGVNPKDRTLLLVKPGYDLIVSCFALLYLGAIPIIIDPGMGLKTLLNCIRISGPKNIIGIPAALCLTYFFRKTFNSITLRIKISKGFVESICSKSKTSDYALGYYKSTDDELAAIVFTSGSTGRPKGVRYLHKNFNAQIETLHREFHLRPGEVDLVTLPIFALFNPALSITSVIPEMNPRKPAEADSELLVNAIINHNVTTAFCSPIIGKKLSVYCNEKRIKLPGIKRLMLAGAPSAPELINDLSKIISNGRVIIPYGATEALPVSFTDHHEIRQLTDSILRGEGSCIGKPINGVSVLLMPVRNSPLPHEHEEKISPIVRTSEVGEICASGKIVTDGYDQMPGATRDARFIYKSSEYHRMGDLGYWDNNKILRFLGRKVECVPTIQGPLETERCEPIVNAISGVKRSALIGIGGGKNKEPCLVVELISDKGVQIKEVISQVRALLKIHFQKYNIIRIFLEEHMPVDPRHNAKIHRLALAKKWTQAVLKNDKTGINS